MAMIRTTPTQAAALAATQQASIDAAAQRADRAMVLMQPIVEADYTDERMRSAEMQGDPCYNRM